jgi:hypothetical protein
MGWARSTPDSSGLLKYDGVDWEFYDQNNSNLPAYWVNNLLIDSLGNLWMSGNGLIKFDGFNFIHYTPQNSGLYSTDIKDIQIDEHNNKWIIHPDAISVFNDDGVTSVEVGDGLPNIFALHQNYPNPFNPTIKVFDVLGSEVATLVSEEKPSGIYEVEFDGTGLPSGIYFYRLRTGNFTQTKKMILLK